jgi:drug/metabolite transporter (DMT)-like permease
MFNVGANSIAMNTSQERHWNPYLVLAAAMCAIAWAAPLVRFAVAPALVISAWRLIFSTAVVGGITLARAEPGSRPDLTARDLVLAGVAGASLAGHFWTWVASVQTTTVA